MKRQKSCANWYDYGARMYDPALGRWHCVDPSSELYYPISPFVISNNNPLRYVDPNGRWFWEASHIRQARKVARKTDGEFKKWKSESNGKRYASVTHKTTSEHKANDQINITTDYTTDQINVTTSIFKPGQERWNTMNKAGLGMYEKMRVTTSGWDNVVARAKSGDAWAAGTSAEYNRNGQAPGIMKAAAGLNPLVSVPNAISVIATGMDMYGVKADTKTDRVLAGVEILSSVVGVSSLKGITEGAKNTIKAADGANTVIQGANDGGLLDGVKQNINKW